MIALLVVVFNTEEVSGLFKPCMVSGRDLAGIPRGLQYASCNTVNNDDHNYALMNS